MPNREIADWQKVVIMACAPFFGDRVVAKKAGCSVFTVRKYRKIIKETGKALEVEVADEYDDAPYVSTEAMELIEEIVADGLDEDEPGRV